MLEVLVGAGLGLLFSMLGAGGGVLCVPALLFLFHEPLDQATGTSLAIVFAIAVVSFFFHWRHGNVDGRVSVAFAATALLGAPLGGLLHPLVPHRVTLVLFCAVLLVVAVRMWRDTAPGEASGRFSLPLTLVLGLVVGTVTGLLGVGGGFLIVPALTTLLGVPMRKAVGSSAAIICASSFTGGLTYAFEGVVQVTTVALMAGGGLVGATIGVPLSKRLPEHLLRRGFSVVCVLIGIRMGFEVWHG